MWLGKNKIFIGIMFFLLLLASFFLTSCSNGNARNNASNGTNIGTLPNGSTVYASPISFATSPGAAPQNGQIGISGGTPFYATTITFSNSVPITSRNQQPSFANLTQPYADSNGITVTTIPSPCTLGTIGTSLPTSCQVTVTAANNTIAGTYSITPIANTNGESTILAPLTIVVSGVNPSSAKAITSYSLNGTAGIIRGQHIAVTMPYGTNVTNLIATFTTTGTNVTVNGVTQSSGVTQNNFTESVTYVVTAADGSTANYIVAVTVAPSSAKAITTYSLNGVPGTITGQNIAVVMPSGTDVTNLIATFTTTGASVTIAGVPQVSGVTANNFAESVIYVVTAADSSTANYVVSVMVNIPQYLYELDLSGMIFMYNINESNGVLVLGPESAAVPDMDNASSLTVNAAGTYAYLLDGGGSGGVYMYGINQSTGALTLLAESFVMAGFKPITIAVNQAGTYAYVVNSQSLITPGNISMYSITNGILSPLSPESIIYESDAVSIAITPDGAHAYVTNFDSNTVSMYNISESGVLVLLSPESTVATGNTPETIVVDPTGSYAYVINGSDNTISMYKIDQTTGVLSPLSPESTIATQSQSFYQSMVINSLDSYAYVTNFDSSTISMYSITESGLLVPLSPESAIVTQDSPRSIVISPFGNYAYVIGGSATISMYSIAESGLLVPLSPESTIATTNVPLSITTSPFTGN